MEYSIKPTHMIVMSALLTISSVFSTNITQELSASNFTAALKLFRNGATITDKDIEIVNTVINRRDSASSREDFLATLKISEKQARNFSRLCQEIDNQQLRLRPMQGELKLLMYQISKRMLLDIPFGEDPTLHKLKMAAIAFFERLSPHFIFSVLAIHPSLPLYKNLQKNNAPYYAKIQNQSLSFFTSDQQQTLRDFRRIFADDIVLHYYTMFPHLFEPLPMILGLNAFNELSTLDKKFALTPSLKDAAVTAQKKYLPQASA